MATRKTTTKAPTNTPKAPKKAPVEPVKVQEQVQEQTTPIPTIQARIDRITGYDKVKAFASANIGGAFAIHGLRVVDGEKGMFVAMPSTSFQRDGKTEYQETFHPISNEARKELNDAVAAEGTAAKLEEVKAALLDGSLKVFDTTTFTVGGETLTSYMADVDDMGDFVPETEVIADGYFHESEYRSAPYFDMFIDGITNLDA